MENKKGYPSNDILQNKYSIFKKLKKLCSANRKEIRLKK
jgi:hypothetical protein